MLIKCDALRLEDIKRNGSTKPLVIDCEYSDENIPKRKTLLVKTIGLPRVTERDIYCETFGNLLAREIGIETPEPFIVRIEKDFIDINKKRLWEENITLKAGLGTGCEFFESGFTVVKSNMFLSKEKFEKAVLIYGFDLLTQNPDRTETNPNCAMKGDSIIAFDFEKSFSFLFPIIGQKVEPWEFSKLKLSGTNRHVFKHNLKAKENEINWQPFIKKVKQINTEKLAELCALIPFEFGNYTEQICEHFASIVSNIRHLEFELQRSLL